MAATFNPCPTNCDFELPLIPSVSCEVYNDDLIDQIRFGFAGKPLTTATPVVGSPTYVADTTARAQEWGTRLDNVALKATKPNAIRFLDVTDGQLPAVDQATKTSANGTIIPAKVTPRTVTFVVDDNSDAMYDFLSEFTECPRKILMWFVSGSHVYGGKAGFEATVLASYKISTDGISHSWSITVNFKQRGRLQRDKLSV